MDYGTFFTREELVARLAELGWCDGPNLPNDEQLKVVLKRYQAKFGIDPSGTICRQTERSLARIRFCSHPDHMAMEASAMRWPSGPIGINISAALPGLDFTQTQQVFEWAIKVWTSVCGIELFWQPNPKTADIRAGVGRIDGAAGVLAYSQLADNTRAPKLQQYDDSEAWVFAERPGQFQIDAARVVGHELGHAFGMPHIAAGNWLQPLYDLNIRGPQAGDIQWMQANYGPPKPKAPEPPVADTSAFVLNLTPDQVQKFLTKGYKIVRI